MTLFSCEAWSHCKVWVDGEEDQPSYLATVKSSLVDALDYCLDRPNYAGRGGWHWCVREWKDTCNTHVNQDVYREGSKYWCGAIHFLPDGSLCDGGGNHRGGWVRDELGQNKPRANFVRAGARVLRFLEWARVIMDHLDLHEEDLAQDLGMDLNHLLELLAGDKQMSAQEMFAIKELLETACLPNNLDDYEVWAAKKQTEEDLDAVYEEEGPGREDKTPNPRPETAEEIMSVWSHLLDGIMEKVEQSGFDAETAEEIRGYWMGVLDEISVASSAFKNISDDLVDLYSTIHKRVEDDSQS